MKEIREHSLWTEARRLTLLAYRVTSGFPKDDRVQRLSSEIEGTCVTLLTHLVQTREQPAGHHSTSLRGAKQLILKLHRLLQEAKKERLLRDTEYEWLGREVRSFQRSLEGLNSHA